MDPPSRKVVLRDIVSLEENPRPHGAEKLASREHLYRIRAGPGKAYRVIYQIQDAALVVLVVKVGHRKDVYRSLN